MKYISDVERHAVGKLQLQKEKVSKSNTEAQASQKFPDRMRHAAGKQHPTVSHQHNDKENSHTDKNVSQAKTDDSTFVQTSDRVKQLYYAATSREVATNHSEKKGDHQKEDDAEKSYQSLLIWDFAGQTEFYEVHRCFLAKERTIYFLVTDVSKRLDSKIAPRQVDRHLTTKQEHYHLKTVLDYLVFWINSVYAKVTTPISGKLAPLIIVGTHAKHIHLYDGDGTPEENYRNKIMGALSSRITNSLKKVHNVIFIDNSENNLGQFVEIRYEIVEQLIRRGHWGTKIPINALQFLKMVDNIRSNHNHIIKKTDLKEVYKMIEPRESQLNKFENYLDFYHNIGDLIYENKEKVNNYVTISPKVLIESFFRLLQTKNQMGLVEKFKFNIDKDELIDNYIEQMLEHHALIIKDVQHYFVPLLLDDKPFDLKLGNKATKGSIVLIFQDFCPLAVFHKLIVMIIKTGYFKVIKCFKTFLIVKQVEAQVQFYLDFQQMLNSSETNIRLSCTFPAKVKKDIKHAHITITSFRIYVQTFLTTIFRDYKLNTARRTVAIHTDQVVWKNFDVYPYHSCEIANDERIPLVAVCENCGDEFSLETHPMWYYNVNIDLVIDELKNNQKDTKEVSLSTYFPYMPSVNRSESESNTPNVSTEYKAVVQIEHNEIESKIEELEDRPLMHVINNSDAILSLNNCRSNTHVRKSKCFIIVAVISMALLLVIAIVLPTTLKSKATTASPKPKPTCSLNNITHHKMFTATFFNINNCPHVLSISAINESAVYAVCKANYDDMTNYAIIYNQQTQTMLSYYKKNVSANILHTQYMPLQKKTYNIVYSFGTYTIMQEQNIIYSSSQRPSTIFEGRNKEPWFLRDPKSIYNLTNTVHKIIKVKQSATFATYIPHYDVIVLGSKDLLQGYTVSNGKPLFFPLSHNNKEYRFNAATSTPCNDAIVIIGYGGESLNFLSPAGKQKGTLPLKEINRSISKKDAIKSISRYSNTLFIGTRLGTLIKLTYKCICP